MGFTVINKGFTCEVCGILVPPASGTCRNHCTQCLSSKHVDESIPGDRASSCHGLMNATKVEGTDPEKLVLLHECARCGKSQRNKIALDDNKEKIFKLMAL